MKKHCFVVAALFSVLSISVAAQTAVHFCGSDAAAEKLFADDPAARVAAEAKQHALLEQSRVYDRSTSPPTYIIPVVFHIVHNYGFENIADAQVMDAMNILNRDFRKLNGDTAQIISPFDTLAADAEIEFRLAQLDPNGNCTNGIERIASMETYVGDDGSKLNAWPRDRYLNVWVVRQTFPGVAGYSYFPAMVDPVSMAHLDGIVMLHDFIGSIGTASVTTSRFFTHEVGHWLGLQHPWGPGSPGITCGDDGIADTPVTMGFTSCSNLSNSDICNPGTPENVQNYMENSYCQRMFTSGQRNFMHAALNSTISQRSNLWTNGNLSATGVFSSAVVCTPHTDFKANRRMLCEGASVTFTDLSWGSSATAWQWTLSGPATLTSTQQNPLFAMNTAGVYDVTLIAGNSAGADTITRAGYLLVSGDTATFSSLYSESFEVPGTIMYMGYIANDQYGNGTIFTQSDSVGHTGTGSAVLNNSEGCLYGDKDDLITPSYHLSYNTGMQLQFVYAYAAKDTAGTSAQTLKLYSSIDCGSTWTARWTRTGTALETASPVLNGPFVPAGTMDWDTITVNLPSSLAQDNVRFKFEFTSPDDNMAKELYIDEINILATNVGVNEQTSSSSFEVYPNPGNGNSVLAYSLSGTEDVSYAVYDVSGRLISSVDLGQQSAGYYSLPLSAVALAPGTYMIRVTTGEAVSAKKFVVTQ